MYVCRVRVAARVRTLSFSFFSFLRRSSSLEEELELLSLSLELEPGIRPGLRRSALWRGFTVSAVLATFVTLPLQFSSWARGGGKADAALQESAQDGI